MALPFELVRMILRLACQIPFPINLDPCAFKTPYPKRLITLSSVCRLWRDVVIKDPTFWSVIILPSNLSFIQMSISRSGQAPLVVDITFTGKEFSRSMYTMVFDEYHRFKRLAIEFDGLEPFSFSEELALVQSFMSCFAPMLETLHLGIPEPPPQLDGLLKGGAPQLRELYIRGECIPSLSFTSLRVLDIALEIACDDYTILYENLLVLLKANPQLESFSFDADAIDFPIDPNMQPVDLPNLKYLAIRTPKDGLSGFLGRLYVPSDARNLFETYKFYSADSSSRRSPLAQLYIQIDINTCFMGAIQSCSPDISVSSANNRDCSRPPLVLQNTLPLKYDLSTVTTCSITFYDEVELHFTVNENESIRNIFRSLTGLRTLQVDHWDRDVEQAEEPEMPYLDGLMYPVGLDVPNLACPLLVELEIMHPTASLSYANQLKRCIQVRSDANYPFSGGVKFFDCTKLSSGVRTLLDGLVEWEEDES